jgi:hypothetical protein
MEDQIKKESQESVEPKLIVTTELDERYQIQKGGRNLRLATLRMKAQKIGKKTFVTEEQLAILDAYDAYLKQHGSSEGFPIPEPSGPWETEEIKPELSESQETAITVAEEQAIAYNSPEELQITSQREYDPELEKISKLVENAQKKATGILIAEEILTNDFIDNPSKLPPELREKIKQVRKSEAPDPLTYAASLLESMRNYKSSEAA